MLWVNLHVWKRWVEHCDQDKISIRWHNVTIAHAKIHAHSYLYTYYVTRYNVLYIFNKWFKRLLPCFEPSSKTGPLKCQEGRRVQRSSHASATTNSLPCNAAMHQLLRQGMKYMKSSNKTRGDMHFSRCHLTLTMVGHVWSIRGLGFVVFQVMLVTSSQPFRSL